MNKQTEQELVIVEGDCNLLSKGPFIVTKTYFANGALKSEAHYQHEHLHGRSCFYTEEGQILSESWFWQGKRVSVCLQFYPSGAPYAVLFYKTGEKEGKQVYFYENGQKKTGEEFSLGKLHGASILYWPNGQIKREAFFRQGVRHGMDRMFDEQGNLLDENQYVGGKCTETI
jgi:antitoxin component YwqK of YwqJK toxin-antitoxin module